MTTTDRDDDELAECRSYCTALAAEVSRLRPLVARMAKLGSEPAGDVVNWYAEWADISIACRAVVSLLESEDGQ